MAAGFCAHGIAGAGGVGQVMAEWILDGEPELRHLEDGHPPLRPPVPRPAYTLARSSRPTRPTTTSTTPTRSARRAGRCALARHRVARELGAASARSAAGSGRTGSSRTRRRATRRCGRAAGPASTGARRSAPSRRVPRHRRALRRDALLQDGGLRARRRRAAQRICANDVDRDVGSVTYTQLLNERGGIECDLTVTRLADDRFSLVTGTAFGNHDLAWIRRSRLPGGGRVACATSPPPGPASGCGVRAPATCSQPLTPGPRRTRPSRT